MATQTIDYNINVNAGGSIRTIQDIENELNELNQEIKDVGVGSEAFNKAAGNIQKLNKELAIDLALTGGDDYELCFTIPPHMSQSDLKEMITTVEIHYIGKIDQTCSKLNLIDENGRIYKFKSKGYQHF